ncbi:MAG: hypothetical protein ACEQSX_16995 [Baekduiaceae bacterium]
MNLQRSSLRIALTVAALLGAGATPAAAGQVAWRSAQPAPPPGAPFSGTVGEPADLQFFAPNFGLMMVAQVSPVGAFGNGLLVFDGREWRRLSTVCGSAGGRIAIAGPREWWTATAERLKPGGPPDTLCHFRDGAVVASYAVPATDPDNAYPAISGAACTSPSDCWFAGAITSRPSISSLFVRWDGASLTRVVHPTARGIADLQAYQGRVTAGTVVGARVGESAILGPEGAFMVPQSVNRAEPDGARILRTLEPNGAVSVPAWAPRADDPDDVQATRTTQLVDIRALDADGQSLWIAGRGSESATRPLLLGEPPIDFDVTFPDALAPVAQRPLLAVRTPGAAAPREVVWDADADIRTSEVIHDLAVIPGTSQAWLAMGDAATFPRDTSAVASLARVEFAPETDGDGLVGFVRERVDLSRADLLIGDASKVDCPAVDDCWMVTRNGWVYHLSDPDRVVEQNTDPAIRSVISVRPADPRTPRDDPDTVPPGESAAYVAPPVEEDAPVEAQAPQEIAALFRVLGKPRVRKVRGRYRIEIRIQLRRRARVQLVGRRAGKVVARTSTRTLKPGRHTLRLNVKRKRWPTALRFVTRDLEIQQPAAEDDLGGNADDTVTTG